MADPTPAEQKARIDRYVERGLRAQLKTGSLLTGQMYVALGIFPNAAPATIDWTKSPRSSRPDQARWANCKPP